QTKTTACNEKMEENTDKWTDGGADCCRCYMLHRSDVSIPTQMETPGAAKHAMSSKCQKLQFL
ncbi:hypothetical protein P3371_24550, partial [Vibrio parahaemolyticus]|nr:hypothetical protein [Vibrio parahaemolyticus]